MNTCRLYKERLAQIDSKLEEVRAGRAAEYLEPLQQLQEQMQIRTQVAGNFYPSLMLPGDLLRRSILVIILG